MVNRLQASRPADHRRGQISMRSMTLTVTCLATLRQRQPPEESLYTGKYAPTNVPKNRYLGLQRIFALSRIRTMRICLRFTRLSPFSPYVICLLDDTTWLKPGRIRPIRAATRILLQLTRTEVKVRARRMRGLQVISEHQERLILFLSFRWTGRTFFVAASLQRYPQQVSSAFVCALATLIQTKFTSGISRPRRTWVHR